MERNNLLPKRKVHVTFFGVVGTEAVKACLVKCMQHFNAKSCTIVVGEVLHAHVGSSLKMVKFLLHHFLMLHDVVCVWPAPSHHLTT